MCHFCTPKIGLIAENKPSNQAILALCYKNDAISGSYDSNYILPTGK